MSADQASAGASRRSRSVAPRRSLGSVPEAVPVKLMMDAIPHKHDTANDANDNDAGCVVVPGHTALGGVQFSGLIHAHGSLRKANTLKHQRVRFLRARLVAVENAQMHKVHAEPSTHVSVLLDQVMHEGIHLLRRRLTHENEVKPAMTMLGELFHPMGDLCTWPALRQHVVLIALIDQTHRAVGKKARPILKLVRGDRHQAALSVIKLADISGIHHPALIFEFQC